MLEAFFRSLPGRAVGAALDASILFSFDRTGFLRHRADFRSEDLEVDARGRCCLVTGPTSGLGRATATALAARGASVRLLCRDRERGEAVREAIRAATGNDDVAVQIVDLASFASIRTFLETYAEPRVDVLVHNAGVLPSEREETADGLELALATNVVGPFLLTHGLIGKLRASLDARVVTVASGGLYAKRLDLAALEAKAGSGDDGVATYALTKRAEVILNELWADRLFETRVAFHAMHPGWADTPGVASSLPRFRAVLGPILRSPEEGADTIVWLSLCARVASETGGFWFDRRRVSTHLTPWTRETAEERERLWQLVSDLAGLTSSGRAQSC